MVRKTIFKIVTVLVVAGVVAGGFAWLPIINAQAAGPYGRGGSGGGYGTATGAPVDGAPASDAPAMRNAYRGYGARGAYAGSGVALTPLTEAESQALVRAIQEEFRSQALYESMVNTFGNVIPFSAVARSEAQHAAVLVNLANKYGVEAPEFPTGGGLPTFATIAEACQAGVEAEIADAALYDELMAVTPHSDLLRVYANLQSASLNNHLPAFEACK